VTSYAVTVTFAKGVPPKSLSITPEFSLLAGTWPVSNARMCKVTVTVLGVVSADTAPLNALIIVAIKMGNKPMATSFDQILLFMI